MAFLTKGTKDKYRRELVNAVRSKALTYVVKSLPENERSDYEGQVTEEYDQEHHTTTVIVHMKCEKCKTTKKKSSVIPESAWCGGHADRSSAAGEWGKALGIDVSQMVADHHKACTKRRATHAAIKTRDKPVKKKPAKKKRLTPACKVCGATDSKYPGWDGPCAHQIDKGVKYSRFRQLTREYRL